MISNGRAHVPAGEPVVRPEIGRVRFDAGKTIWLWGLASSPASRG